MQKTQRLLLLAAVLAAFQSAAQPIAFAPVGAQWTFTNYQIFTPPISETPHVVTVEAKELYQGKLCSKLVNTGSVTVPDPLYLHQQNDTVFYYSDVTQRFEMLYDFGAGAGEGWTIKGLATPIGIDSLMVTVEAVETRIVSGVSLNVQVITFPLLPFEWGPEIVEAAGNLFFLAPHYSVPENTPHNLRCYTDAAYDLRFVPFACDTSIVLSARAPDAGALLTIAPNPTSETFQLQLAAEAGYAPGLTAELYDAYGRLCRQTALAGEAVSVSVADLPPGLYRVLIRDGRTVVGAGKVVVAR